MNQVTKLVLMYFTISFIHAQSAKHVEKRDGKRIYYGDDARIEDFPFFARVVIPKPNSAEVTVCGGSIISSRWILTAGHCRQQTQNRTRVFVGIDHRAERPKNTTKWASLHISHPDYFNNDIGLIKLTKKLQFNERVQPILLPRVSEENTYDKFKAVGFGSTEKANSSKKLLVVTFTEIEDEQCRIQFEELSVYHNKTPEEWSIFWQNHICITKVGGKGTCKGDSGGPLVARRAAGSAVLIGVTSGGIKDPETKKCLTSGNSSAIFTRVSRYLDWINSTIRNNTGRRKE